VTAERDLLACLAGALSERNKKKRGRCYRTQYSTVTEETWVRALRCHTRAPCLLFLQNLTLSNRTESFLQNLTLSFLQT